MSYQVLARKWRPQNFSELVGQDHVQRALINALDNERLHHAYLFTGTRGVGKTTIARILARALNCEEGVSSTPCGQCSACTEIGEGRFVDLIEVDAASRTRVEDTRELLDNVQYAPTRGRYKVYLIDEVHMLSGHSFNALLKTLEEPPPHVKFLLATTDPQRLPVTILSRCLQFNLKSLSPVQISRQLEMILQHEEVDAQPAAIRQLAQAADGSMRDALSLLDQAIAYCKGALDEQEVRAMLGTIDRDVIYRLLDALAGQDAARLLEEVRAADSFAPDYAALLADLVSVLQRVALAQAVPDAIDEGQDDRDVIARLAQDLTPEDVQLYYQTALIGRRDLPLSPEPRGGFEMVLLRMLAFRPVSAAGGRDAAVARPAAGTVVPATAGGAGSADAARHRQSPAPDRTGDAASADAGAYDWGALVESMALRGMLREMALNCACIGIENGLVRLTMEETHRHLLSDARIGQLESALARCLGQPVQVRLSSMETIAQETPARRQTRQTEARQQRAVDAIARDDNIKALQDAFGATVCEDSIRPLDG